MAPPQQKEETVRALVDLLEAIARAGPTLLLFEDLHWADPTTLEVLDRWWRGCRQRRCLPSSPTGRSFAPAGRPGPVTHGGPRPALAAAEPSAGCSLTGGKSLPPGLLEQIVEKTDGIPLFVEELTRSILESGDLAEEATHYA